MAVAPWTYGPIPVSFGSRRGVIGRVEFTGAGNEDLVTGLRRVQSIHLQAIQGAPNQDNTFNTFRNTVGTQDNLNDAPGTVHLVNISGGGPPGAPYSVIIMGY